MDISYQVETEAQFWTQLEDSVKENRSAFLSDIDHALTSFVNLAARYYGKLRLSLRNVKLDWLRLLSEQAYTLRQKKS